MGLILSLAGMMLYGIEQSRWWDERTQLAQESHRLHLQLEANIFRLFKQHGDALLIGDRDEGSGESDLRQKIDENLVDIRNVIAREIQLVGEEEFAELETLLLIEAGVRRVTQALASFSETGEPLDEVIQIERLAALLDREIDITLTRRIDRALQEELDEVQEVIVQAAAFRRTNRIGVLTFVVVSICLIAIATRLIDKQMRRPLMLLPDRLSALRRGEYDVSMDLGGGREFQDLGTTLRDMAQSLALREAHRDEQKRELEAQVTLRTRELQGLVAKLEASGANRRRLMADISHELRTPLAIIQGEADVALRTSPDLPDTLSDTLARIRDAARHTNQIVNDMLTVARQEAGELRLDKREADLRVVLREAVDMFPQSIVHIIPPQPVRSKVDRVRLRQAILALFQNARRYGGPTISASLDTEGSTARLIVEDDGPGMSAAEKSQAFDRFFRGSNVTGTDQESSGLGLPIVKTIIEAHGGRVVLTDGDSGGLRVVVELPLGPNVRLVATGDEPETSRRRA